MATFTWILPPTPPAPSAPASSSSVATPAEAMFGGYDQEVDPATGDYVDTTDGAWSETQTSRTAVMMQLEIRYGEWHVDPDAGSRIPAMLETGDPITPQMMVDETRRALQLLVDDGIIADLSVQAGTFDPANGRLDLEIAYTDTWSNSAVELLYQPF